MPELEVVAFDRYCIKFKFGSQHFLNEQSETFEYVQTHLAVLFLLTSRTFNVNVNVVTYPHLLIVHVPSCVHEEIVQILTLLWTEVSQAVHFGLPPFSAEEA